MPAELYLSLMAGTVLYAHKFAFDNKGSSLENSMTSAGKWGFWIPYTPLLILLAMCLAAQVSGQDTLGGRFSLGLGSNDMSISLCKK